MEQNKLRRIQGRRLATVREAALFKSARDAALSCGWAESTYRAHENGSRTIGQDDATKYVTAFRARGANGYTAQWILFGTYGDGERERIEAMLKEIPPDGLAEVYAAALAARKRYQK
jgi:acetolactate synthase small subunit